MQQRLHFVQNYFAGRPQAAPQPGSGGLIDEQVRVCTALFYTALRHFGRDRAAWPPELLRTERTLTQLVTYEGQELLGRLRVHIGFLRSLQRPVVAETRHEPARAAWPPVTAAVPPAVRSQEPQEPRGQPRAQGGLAPADSVRVEQLSAQCAQLQHDKEQLQQTIEQVRFRVHLVPAMRTVLTCSSCGAQLQTTQQQQRKQLHEYETAMGKAHNEQYMTTGASNLASAFPLVRLAPACCLLRHDAS
jgi:hypothetical protein